MTFNFDCENRAAFSTAFGRKIVTSVQPPSRASVHPASTRVRLPVRCRMQPNFEPVRMQVEAWQRSELTDATAKQ